MAAKELAATSATKSNPPSTPLSGVKYPTPHESPLITPSKSLSSGNLVSPPSDSKLASDPRFNADEYAYNKIFVGGLHYDTRDRKFCFHFPLSYLIFLHIQLNFELTLRNTEKLFHQKSCLTEKLISHEVLDL